MWFNRSTIAYNNYLIKIKINNADKQNIASLVQFCGWFSKFTSTENDSIKEEIDSEAKAPKKIVDQKMCA